MATPKTKTTGTVVPHPVATDVRTKSAAELRKEASNQILAQIAAAAAPLQAQAAQQAELDRQRALGIQGFATAAADYAKPVAGQTQDIYNAAGDRQTILAKGFSAGAQDAIKGAANQANDYLAKIQGPGGQQVQDNSAAVGDVLYGTGGYIPGSSLNQQGAGMAAIAARLPSIALSKGQEDYNAQIAAARTNQTPFETAIANLYGQAPGLTNDLTAQLTSAQLDQQKLADQQANTKWEHNFKVGQANASLDYKYDSLNAMEKYRQATLDMRRQGLQFQYDKLNIGIAQGYRPDAALSKLYGHVVDASGRTITDATGKPIPVKANDGTRPLSADKIAVLTSDATYLAMDAFNGAGDLPPLNFGQALTEMRKGVAQVDAKGNATGKTNGSIPLPIALKALRQAGYKIPAKYDKLMGGQAGSAAPFGDTRSLSSASVAAATSSFLGVPYVWGGTSATKGLDCSAFVQQAMAKLGVSIPRTTYAQVKAGTPVSRDDLQPGDAIFTRPNAKGEPQHVGLYLGDGMVQESPHTGDVNKLIPLDQYLGGGFVAARRYLNGNG